jgi:hypothetical protein
MQTYTGEDVAQHPVLENMRRTARDMAGWLKFIGIVTFLSGLPAALTIVGLVVAWVPLWLGVLLVQAGSAAQRGDDEDLLVIFQKLRTFFMIQGIMMVIAFIILILTLVITGFSLVWFWDVIEAARESYEI